MRPAYWLGGMIGLMALLLIPFFTFSTLFNPTYIPTWPLPTPYQASAEDWVKVELIAPTTGLTPETTEVVLQVQYSLQAQAEADLFVELRSQLDLDIVDLGSEFSNLLAYNVQRVPRGTGTLEVRLALSAAMLNRFPPGSRLLPLARLSDIQNPTQLYFRQAFAGQALTVPDFNAVCALAAEEIEVALVAVTPPANRQFTAAQPRAQVTVQYTLPMTTPQIFTLLVGLANPNWAGQAQTAQAWEQHMGSYAFQALSPASGSATLDVYAWYPSTATQHIPDADGQVALAVAVVCGYHAYHPDTLVYTQVFPEQLFQFAPELRSAVTPTYVPTPLP